MPIRHSPLLTPRSLAARRARPACRSTPSSAAGRSVLPAALPGSAKGCCGPATPARKPSTAACAPTSPRLSGPGPLMGGVRWTGLRPNRGAWPWEGAPSEQSWNVLWIQCQKARGSSLKTVGKALRYPAGHARSLRYRAEDPWWRAAEPVPSTVRRGGRVRNLAGAPRPKITMRSERLLSQRRWSAVKEKAKTEAIQ
jgi:hypothetical protein